MPHTFSDAQLGVFALVLLPLLGGSLWLYNAYRLGRLKRKPKAPADPRLVTAVIFLLIVLAIAVMIAIP